MKKEEVYLNRIKLLLMLYDQQLLSNDYCLRLIKSLIWRWYTNE